MVRLIALKAFTHRGTSYETGDPVPVSTVEAIVLLRRQFVARPSAAKSKKKKTAESVSA